MTLSTCCGVAPSSSKITISELNGARERLARKPSQLPVAAGALAMRLPSAMVEAMVVPEDFDPFTTSNSFITLAGLKK